tara:strand:+ start:2676 stop:2852 length:177 start_codon:yes stop_codon:yes gene_type:complete
MTQEKNNTITEDNYVGTVYLYHGGELPNEEIKVKSEKEAHELGKYAEHYEYEAKIIES